MGHSASAERQESSGLVSTIHNSKHSVGMEPLTELFANQYGVASDRQIRNLDVTWERQHRLIAEGLWTRHAHGVTRVAGSPTTWLQQAMAATLLPGAKPLIAGRAAARLHRLDGFLADDSIEIVIGNRSQVAAPPGVRIRRSRRLTPADRYEVDGIPVTTVPLTLIHLAADGCNAAKALDGALRDGHSPTWLRQTFERWRGFGVSGPTTMLRLLDDRVNTRLPRSWFQRLAKEVLAECGIPLVDEWPVVDASGKLLAELDLANVELKVGVECQSWKHHGSPTAQAQDLRRKRKLRRLGWEIVEVWWSDLDQIDDVLADLRLALDRAQSALAQPRQD